MAPLRVLIAEDAYLNREGTRRLLEDSEEVEVVGAAGDLDTVLAEARRLEPDVVLMDVKMPPGFGMEGIEAAHAIKAERPQTGIVMLTQHDDEEYVWALLEHGVAGYGYLHRTASALRDPIWWSAIVVNPCIVLAVTFDMVTKPGAVGSSSALAVALAVGCAAAVPLWRHREPARNVAEQVTT